MPSPEQQRIHAQFSPHTGAPLPPLEQARQEWDQIAAQAPLLLGTTVEALEVADVPAEWVGVAGQHEGAALLYLHGGDHELLLNDATRLAERARQASVAATLKV
ncbi:MAG: hypothetical protein OHK0022_16940 [Roseiflexaceae bacterium]